MSQDATTLSTAANWLVILIISVLFLSFMSFVWEIAKSLWANWGNSASWLSSAIAPIVGVLLWWGVGLVAYLTAPRTAASPTPAPSTQQSATASGGSTITQNQAGRDINEAGRDIVINNLAPTETIPGTNVTEQQVRDFFPYGYVIFSFRDGNWTYSPLPSDKMQFTADWSKVTIIPNFGTGEAKWEVPDVKSTNTSVHLQGYSFGQDNVPLNPNQFWIMQGLVFSGQPVPVMGTLSDNQRFPVFVLGFRTFPHARLREGSIVRPPWAK